MTTFKLAYVGNRAIINSEKMMFTMCLGRLVSWQRRVCKGWVVPESWKIG